MHLGLTPRPCCANSLGRTHPCHYGGLCNMADVSSVTPTPVRLTCRALEGGPATPSKCFLVTLLGHVVTLGRRGAIPATVNCRRPPPCVQRHAGHCGNSPGAVRHAGTGRRHACHCISYGSSSATSSNPPGDITVDAKCAPSAKHTASRTSWLHTRKESRNVPVNFP
jgi:hypothetical protein